MKKHILSLIKCLLISHAFMAQSWLPQGEGLLPYGYEVKSISVVHDSVIWISASLKTGFFSPIKIFRSVDAGNHWQISDLSVCEYCRGKEIQAIDVNTAWLTVQGYPDDSRLYKTTDGGKSWLHQLTSPAAGQGIELYDDEHIACRSAYSFAWSQDGGEQWMTGMMTSIPADFYPFATTSNLQSDTAWFGMAGNQWYAYHPEDAKLIRTTHYGSEYSLMDTGLDSVAVIDMVCFGDSKHGIMKFVKWVPTLDWDFFPAFTWSEQDQLARTIDGGASWNVIPPFTNDIRSITTVPGAPQTFIVAGEAQFYTTTDSGITWDSGPLPYPPCCLDFSSPDAGWMAVNGTTANHPLVLKWNGDILSGKNENPMLRRMEINIFPNPANDIIHFNLKVDPPAMHTIKVIDATGQIVIHKQTEVQDINIEQLPAGIYFLHVYAADKTGFVKFVKE